MNKKYYSWFEILIDHLVPFAVIALLAIIIIDFFFLEFKLQYELYINIADYTILLIFALDLFFKYLRIRNINNFLKTCWLDIIAIFPFFLIFRVFESLLLLTELPQQAKTIQLVFHESVAFSQETSKIIKETEAAGKVSRVKMIIRMFENVERTPRIIKALPFYEQPVGKHHLHKIHGKKEYKFAKKEFNIGVKEIDKDIGKSIDLERRIIKKAERRLKRNKFK